MSQACCSLALLILIFEISGCGQKQSPIKEHAIDDNDSTIEELSYPEAVYGVANGDVIDNLDFQLSDETSMTLGDVYYDEEAKVLLLSIGAGWCTGCVEEQPALNDLYDFYSAAGLRVLLSLNEQPDLSPADLAYAQWWKDFYANPFWVSYDPEKTMTPYVEGGTLPVVMLIDLETMTIIHKDNILVKPEIEMILEELL